MGEIRAILFDVFGTVVDWRGGVIAALSDWGAAAGVAADWPALADAWRGEYGPAMERVRSGAQPWTALDDLHRESLRALLPRFGVAVPDEAALTHLAHAWRRLPAWPDSVDGLRRLRARHAVAALSNGNVALLVAMARHAGLPWDMIFGADLYRHYKPDPETYLGACGFLALPPGETLMAAAHPSDLAAARALGLRTAFIARPWEHGPGQPPPDPGGTWDFHADSILELADMLGA